MSTSGAHEGPYRQLARHSLQHAADELNGIPKGRVNTSELQAHATQAQAIASIAIAQALLELGDVLRAALDDTEHGDGS